MFFYVFNQRYWGDKVVSISLDKKACKPGDFVLVDGNEALCLWESIAFQELIKSRYSWWWTVQIVVKKLLTKNSLKTMHRFVNHRFTTYKNTVPLFLTNNIEALLKKNPLTAKSKKVEQSLIIFPTVWSLMNQTTASQRNAETAVVLHGASTVVQKAKAFWGIKKGEIITVYCTYSQIFQDWKNLTHITVYDQHSRWYKNQQDPRWYLPTVLDFLVEQYDVKLSTTWYKLVA